MTRKLTPAQLDEIEVAAKRIPPGPWELDGDEVILDRPATDDDMAYLATVDPATTLALVAEVRELRAKVERVRALHQPAETVDDGDATFDPAPCTCGHWDYTQCPDRRALGEEA